MSEENKAVVRRWLEEVLSQGKVEVLDEICADDYVEYDPAYPGGHLRREELKQAIPVYRSAYPDLRFVIEDMIAEADNVAVYWTMTGTHLGSFRGMPPSGKSVEADGMTLVRLRNGKSIQARSCWDATGLRQRIGTRPPSEAERA
jgi:steroid delta-isomerase-like uncharacterized protein